MDKVDANAPAESMPLTIWHESFELAMQESQETGKPVLVDFTGSDWCHWCVKLKQDVFETRVFETWASNNVILLELDYPKRGFQKPTIKRQNAELAQRYNIDSYPTVLILDSAGDVLAKTGYQKDPLIWIDTVESQLANGTGSTIANAR